MYNIYIIGGKVDFAACELLRYSICIAKVIALAELKLVVCNPDKLESVAPRLHIITLLPLVSFALFLYDCYQYLFVCLNVPLQLCIIAGIHVFKAHFRLLERTCNSVYILFRQFSC